MYKKSKIKVLIIEDSKLYQAYMTKILSEDDQLEVGGVAGTAKEALQLVESVKPDVITLDMGLPDVRGFELLTTLVRRYNLPIIVVTSVPQMCQEAISLGAKDFIEKLQNGDKQSTEQFALLLKLKVKMQAISFSGKYAKPAVLEKRGEPAARPLGARGMSSVIAIGASLGGTETTLEILKKLPVWIPGIVIVQHMPQGFTNAYAERLNNNCALTVKEAKNGDRVEAGKALIAKGGEQLTLYRSEDGYRVRLSKNDGKNTFCPSVDVLFESVAKEAGKAATGVILTGMGHDGARGMLSMHEAGAYNIAESEETCVVFGMPRAAAEAGGVDVLLPKHEIAEALIKRFSQR